MLSDLQQVKIIPVFMLTVFSLYSNCQSLSHYLELEILNHVYVTILVADDSKQWKKQTISNVQICFQQG